MLPRAELDVEAAIEKVRPICDDVRHRGAAAVREYTLRFDGVDLATTRVPAAALAGALAALAPDLRAALEETVRRLRLVCRAQRPADVVTSVGAGATVTERYVAVGRAGVYVPGGLVTYPSSVLMNVVPAQVAGVPQIAVASPPRDDGLPSPAVLAACALLGVSEVHAVGGAQAIAMLGYGTADCAAADTVTGPGNIYVAAAKRLLLGTISTDAEAGPTEIAIIADDTADPEFVAADLIAQAEHDPLAACLLITTDPGLADRVDKALVPQIAAARHRERVQAALAGQSACVLVDDVDAALATSDAWAPEHLEIQAQRRGCAGPPGPQRGRHLRGPVRPGLARRLPRGLQPRAADRRHRAAHRGPVRADLPARHSPGRIRAGRAGGSRAAHRRARRGRGPGRARRRGAGAHPPDQAVNRYPPDPAAAGAGAPGGSSAGSASLPAWLPIRDDLAGHTAYGAPQIDVPVRLNTNENPYPPSPALVQAISQAVAEVAGTLNRYPDRDAVALRADLAAYLGHGLDADQVWAANGSNEIIQQLFQAFGGPGRTAMGFEPSYSMHPLIALATGTRWVSGARDADFGLSPITRWPRSAAHQPDLVFLTSPNNPTGAALAPEVIEAVCAAAPGLVIVDEAYAEFARDTRATALTLLPRCRRLVVTRTMSKAFALAGARVGYLAADPAVPQALLLVRLPYHLSAVTQAVARAALALAHEPLATVAALRAQRDELVAWLRGRGLRVADSDANFVLFGEFGDRHVIWQALLDRGVLIRETGPRGWLRVTAGTPAEMAAFRAALDEVLLLAREDNLPDPPIAAARRAVASHPGPAPEASR